MSIFKSSTKKKLDKSSKEMKKQIKNLKNESKTLLKGLNEIQIEIDSLPKVYISVNNINLYVTISKEDYMKGKEKPYRDKVDKIYSEKDVLRYEWLKFWQKAGKDYPKEFDEEYNNFTKLYGITYKEFVKKFNEDHSIYNKEYCVSKERSDEILKELINEYQTKYPPKMPNNEENS